LISQSPYPCESAHLRKPSAQLLANLTEREGQVISKNRRRKTPALCQLPLPLAPHSRAGDGGEGGLGVLTGSASRLTDHRTEIWGREEAVNPNRNCLLEFRSTARAEKVPRWWLLRPKEHWPIWRRIDGFAAIWYVSRNEGRTRFRGDPLEPVWLLYEPSSLFSPTLSAGPTPGDAGFEGMSASTKTSEVSSCFSREKFEREEERGDTCPRSPGLSPRVKRAPEVAYWTGDEAFSFWSSPLRS